jgi:hypothetical protein
VEAVSVLGDEVFDHALSDEGGDDHVGGGGRGEVDQPVDGGFVGIGIGEVAVPKAGPRADDGLLSGAVVGDADGGGDACAGEDDRVGGGLEGGGEFLGLLLDLPIGVDDLFGPELGERVA